VHTPRLCRSSPIKKGHPIPSGNLYHDFFVDLAVTFDAGSKSVEDIKCIISSTADLVAQARKEPGLSVDFSGTHCQADDDNCGSNVAASDIFGDDAMAKQVQALKRRDDSSNRFPFHPFSKILHR
jgi:hypothetical protein